MIFKGSEGKPFLVQDSLCPEKQWDVDPVIMTQSTLPLSQGQLPVSTGSCWTVSESDCLLDFLTQDNSTYCHSQVSWSGTRYRGHGTLYHIKLPPYLTDTHNTHLGPCVSHLTFPFVKHPENMLAWDEKQGVYKLEKKYDIYPIRWNEPDRCIFGWN